MPKKSKDKKTQEELMENLRKVNKKLAKIKDKEKELNEKKAEIIKKIYDASEILPKIHPRARNFFKNMGLTLDSDIIRFIGGDITAVTKSSARLNKEAYLNADTPLKRLMYISGIGSGIGTQVLEIVEEVQNKHSSTE